MKLTRIQLRAIINEASKPMEPIRVKTQKLDDYNPPIGLASVGDGMPENTAIPHIKVGDFFVSTWSHKPPKNYGGLKGQKTFYIVLPDGEAIRIDHDEEQNIKTRNQIKAYLGLLDTHVTPLPIEDIHDLTDQDVQNILKMRKQIEVAIEEFKNL